MADLFIPKELKDLDELLSNECGWDFSEDDCEWRFNSSHYDSKTNLAVSVWEHMVDIRFKNMDLTKVFVGFDSCGDVRLISFLEMGKSIKVPKYEQYNFLNDRPDNCSLPMYNGPWRDNRPAKINEVLKPYFRGLADLKPEFAESLEKCMEYLEKPGPKYEP